jgi:hypothetical protein
LTQRVVVVLLTLVAAIPPVRAADILEEIVEQKYSIDANARFTLKNQDGSIRIYGANTTEMKLQAIKKAYTKDRLGKMEVKVSVRPGEVAINTTYPPKSKWGISDRSGTVDYVIILPWFCDVQEVELGNGEILIEGMRGNEVHAQLGSGRLFGHNCFTDLQLSIGSGGVDIGYDWWEAHGIALDSTIRQGSTHLFLPGEAQFRLHAETAKGQIVDEYSGRENRVPEAQARLDLAVGTGSNAEIKLRAIDGSIKINESYQ